LQNFPGLFDRGNDVAENFTLSFHETGGWASFLRVGRCNDDDRFSFVGNGDGLTRLFNFQEEFLQGFGQIIGANSNDFTFRGCKEITSRFDPFTPP
jgi:hypothetical protein